MKLGVYDPRNSAISRWKKQAQIHVRSPPPVNYLYNPENPWFMFAQRRRGKFGEKNAKPKRESRRKYSEL